MMSPRQMFLLCFALLGLGIFVSAAQAQTDQIVDDYNPDFNGPITALAGSMGRYYASGSFTTVNGSSSHRLALIHPDESRDGVFIPATSFDLAFQGGARVILPEAGGQILIGGAYVPAAYTVPLIHRVRSNGLRDPNFGSVAVIFDSMCVAGDKLYLAAGYEVKSGSSTTYVHKLMRLNYGSNFNGFHGPNVDLTFAEVIVNGSVSCMLPLPDGRLVVGGAFSALNGTPRLCLAVLNGDGSVNDFDMKVQGKVSALAQGRMNGEQVVYFGGDFTSVALNGPSVAAARLFYFRPQDGTHLSSTYKPSPNKAVNTLLALPNEMLVIGGEFTNVGGQARSYFAQLRGDGTLLPGQDAAFNGSVNTLLYDPLDGGRIVVGGSFTQVGGLTRNRFVRLIATGSVDSRFAFPQAGTVRALAQQADGKVWTGGDFASSTTLARRNLARLASDGTLDSTVTVDVDGQVNALASLMDGRTLIGGSFTQVGNAYAAHLARLNADGSHDSAFSLTTDGQVHALATQADGRCYVAGAFANLGGQPRSGVARLNASGSLDIGFAPTIDGLVRCVLPQQDGKIVIGGDFASVNGTARPWLARLESDGSLDSTFAPDLDGSVRCLVGQADGSLLVGGDFTGFLRQLSSAGETDAGFIATPNGPVQVICRLADLSNVLIGGSFTQMNGQASAGIARLSLQDGTLLNGPSTTWGTSVPSIHALLVRTDGSFVAGGSFTVPLAVARSNLACFSGTGSPQPAAPSLAHDTPVAHMIWQRTGAMQELSEVRFDLSLDNGVNWVSLGAGERVPSGWSVPATMSQLPVNRAFQFRARGLSAAGSSANLFQQVTTWTLSTPPILSQPANWTINAAQTVNLYVYTTSPGVSFQWFKDNVPIPQATTDTWAILGTLGRTEAGNYHVVLSNLYGTTTSRTAIVQVTLNPPVISTQPADTTAIATTQAALGVGAQNGPFTFQWYQDDVLVPGATSSQIQVKDTNEIASTRRYKVTVTNIIGTVTSRTATLTVTRPVPTITAEPQDVAVDEGQPFSLRVTTSYTNTTHHHQWYRNGQPILGATDSTYNMSWGSSTGDKSGTYHVVVSNLFGSATSRQTTVLVRTRPVISAYATPLGTLALTGRPLSISVSAMSGGAPYAFRWERSTSGSSNSWQTVTGATSGTLDIPQVNESNNGYYRVTVSNSMGSTTAASIQLRRIAPPQILTIPLSSTERNGGDPIHLQAFTASLSPDFNATYGQVLSLWLKDDVEIPGATNQTLLIASCAESDAGRYSVRFTNEAGSATVNVATITVAPNTPPIITTQPQPRFLHTGQPLALNLNAEGRLPITATWRRNGARLADGSGRITNNASSYAHTATMADSGIYSVLLSNDRGTLYSDFVSVVVVDAVARTLVRRVGTGITLPAASTAKGVSFQWLKNGEPMTDSNEIKGSNQASMTFTKLALTDATIYTCRVTNGADSLVSGTTTLIVQDQPPAITTTSLAGADCGLPYSAPLAATHLPTAFKLTGLPPGLTFNSVTGEVSGTPTKPGTYKIEASATNTYGTGAKKMLSLTVATVPAYMTGSFFSIFPEDDQTAGSRLDVTVTNTGSFTGKLTLHTQAIAIKGTLKRAVESPTAIVEISGIPHKDLGPLSVILDLFEHSPEDAAGTASLSHAFGGSGSELVWALPWSKTHRPTAFEGYHTFTFDGSSADEGGPLGDSYGSATVSSAGSVTYAGKLADDSSFTASFPISESGVSGFFFVNDSGRNHFNAHRIEFRVATPDGDVYDTLSGLCTWRKMPAENSTNYRHGFEFDDSLYGMPYAKPKTMGNPGSIVMNLPVRQKNVVMYFLGGNAGMLPQVSIEGTVSAANVASFPSQAGHEMRSLQVSVAPATGVFTISGTHAYFSDDPFDGLPYLTLRPFKGSGIIINPGQERGTGAGFFLMQGLPEWLNYRDDKLIHSGQMIFDYNEMSEF